MDEQQNIIIYQSEDGVIRLDVRLKEKTLAEYRKFQVKTLSPVEQAYLESIKGIEKKAKRGGKKQ